MQGLANDDNITEMMAMWLVSGGDWTMLLPNGETVLVDVDAVVFGEIVSPHLRTPEIHQKSSEINDLENEPGHVWLLPEVSGVTRDDI